MKKQLWELDELWEEQVWLEIDGKVTPMVYGNGEKVTLKAVLIKFWEKSLRNGKEKGKKAKKQQNPPITSHRKKMFSEETAEEIRRKHAYYNTPKKVLAKEYGCSAKTIRNIINNAY